MSCSTPPPAVGSPRRSNRPPPTPALSMLSIGAGARYLPVPADKVTLFGARGPLPSDVQQGGVGDCWLMSALASMAHVQPQAIRDMIRPTQRPDVFEVRLHVPTDQGLRPRWIAVDTRLATDPDGDLSYAMLGRDGRRKHCVLWPALIEKAFARALHYHYRDGYDSLDGNHAGMAFMLLTGHNTWAYDVAAMDRDALVSKLLDAPKRCMLAGTNKRGVEPLLQAWHYYAVMGMQPPNNVKLRDPHGFAVTVPLDKFQEICGELAELDE